MVILIYTSTAKASVGTVVGIVGGQIISSSIPAIIPSVKGVKDGKTLMERIVEIGSGAVDGYAVKKYVFNNDFNPNDMPKRLLLIAGTDLLSEYITEYVNGQPLSYFS